MDEAALLALLNHVKDHPDDDAPRLVLADWLEQHGANDADRARADFIRLQCQLARGKADDPARRNLEACEQSLQRQYARVWVEDWQPGVAWITNGDTDAQACYFERGLLGLVLTGLHCLLDVPSDDPKWGWVSGLELFGPGPQDVEQLAACPVLGNLNRLVLLPEKPGFGKVMGPSGARALAASPYLSRLTWLALLHSAIDPDGARALAASPHLRGLEYLDLSAWDWTTPNLIGDEGARALAESAYLTRLKRMDLTENDIGDAGASALAGSKNMRTLTHLNLSGNLLSLDGVQALAASPNLGRLSFLSIGGYLFRKDTDYEECASILLKSPFLINLSCLDLGYPYPGGRGPIPRRRCRRDMPTALCGGMANLAFT